MPVLQMHRYGRAADPQAHLDAPEPPPKSNFLVTCSCCWSAHLYAPEKTFNGSPAPSPQCPVRAKQAGRNDSAKLIAVSIIAAVRLNREEIKHSPVVVAKIGDSLRLAEMIIQEMTQSGTP